MFIQGWTGSSLPNEVPAWMSGLIFVTVYTQQVDQKSLKTESAEVNNREDVEFLLRVASA